jgi:hypothetical protein
VPPTVESPGWSFAGVRVYTDQYQDGLLLYGDLINNTGTSQELMRVTGTFYYAQGQVIADEESTYDYWTVGILPPAGRVPFELTVDGIQGAAKFKLRVEAEPSNESPRQDFEFSDLDQWNEEDVYCVEGMVRNPGGELQDYLAIVAVLYDNQDRVVNFGDYYEPYLTDVVGGQPLDFEICVAPPNQGVARYELRAWGQ